MTAVDGGGDGSHGRPMDVPCPNCGALAIEGNDYCTNCGSYLDAAVVGRAAEPANPARPDADPKPPRKSRRPVIVVAVVVVLVGLGIGAGLLVTQQRQAAVARAQASRQAEAADDAANVALAATLTQVAAATDTAGLRLAAASAATPAGQLPAGGTAEASAAANALRAVEVLQDLDADTLDQWANVKPRIQTALDQAQQAGVEVNPAVLSTIDTVVANGQAKLAEWQRANQEWQQNQQAQQAREHAISQYSSSLDDIISRYDQMRRNTSSKVNELKASSSYSTSGMYSYFSDAAAQRRLLRDLVSSLAVPSVVISANSELAVVLGTGVDALGSLLDSLSSCSGRTSCVLSASGYNQFQSMSATNSSAYDAAVAKLRAAVAAEKTAAGASATAAPPRRPVRASPTATACGRRWRA